MEENNRQVFTTLQMCNGIAIIYEATGADMLTAHIVGYDNPGKVIAYLIQKLVMLDGKGVNLEHISASDFVKLCDAINAMLVPLD